MNCNKTTLVITGASGFLGKNLLQQLSGNEQYQVFALSSRPEELALKHHASKNITCVHKDIIETEQAGKILNEAIVVNCAYPRNATGREVAEGLKYIQTVFESAREYRSEAVINISSQSVYPTQRTEAATESMPVCLETPYAVGKYATELMLDSVLKHTDVFFTNIRMSSLIGVAFNQRITNRLAEEAIMQGKIKIASNAQLFGFMDVRDAAAAIIQLTKLDSSQWKNIYNIGMNKGYTLQEIADILSEVFASIENKELVIDTFKNDYTGNTTVSGEMFARETGFTPKYQMKDSLQDIFCSLMENMR